MSPSEMEYLSRIPEDKKLTPSQEKHLISLYDSELKKLRDLCEGQ